MAVTPKSARAKPVAKSGSATLSASEALKAAESALGEKPAPKKPAPRKPVAKAAPVKASAPKPVAKKPAPVAAAKAPAAEPAPVADPVAVVAATTAVDAAPEPIVEDVEAVVAPEPVSAPKTKAKTLPATEGTLIMNDILETGKKFAEDTKAKMETAYADLNEKAKAGVEKSTKAMEELSDIAKGNVEALVESGKIAAKGFETLGQEAVDYSRKSFEKATASIKSFSTAKTPTEFFQLQSQFLSSSFDEFTKEAAKSSEAFMKLAGDISQPLTARVTLVTDKVKSLAA
ncbi:phasin family protein [Sphingobium yanoikuyae]|uniref:Phasin family protein n=1 Tax=Sphingobium yanoikuyae TaxID=13690 RepID=A0AA43BCK4_SPHYA|nr:phasin family protein [Sphingobium yanoikuyae]MDH2131892.1 phasin family protein [Sphingobium yanoikuyae]MDH2151038.1 phasin family protein [Sphingobium yanoikuyae]MDH2166589.1 phasin family protein [Sphingobium yanoikuyae]